MTINKKLGTYPKLNERRWRCRSSIQELQFRQSTNQIQI